MTINNGSSNPDLPRLLYFTTEYPHISHTFIRREILGLEALGYSICRVAINSGSTVVEDVDISEQKHTTSILGLPKIVLARLVLSGLLFAKVNFFRSLGSLIKLNKASDRGLLRHLAYMVEALILLSISRDKSIDHIHVHFGTNATTVALLCREFGGPDFSFTVHGPVEFDQPYGQSLAAKVSAAKFVVAITHFCRAQLMRFAPIQKWDDIHIIGCSVGDEWFDSAQPISEESTGLVSVGRLDEQKGQILLIDAYADAVEQGFNEPLTIIGDGPFRSLIELRIAARGLGDRVQLLGWSGANTIRHQLLASKCLVVSSFAEGLPVVIMEAMALKRPVIATRITGIPELVEHNVNGWLITPGDQAALTEALMTMQRTQRSILVDMGDKAHNAVRQNHLTSTMVNNLGRLFREYV